MTPEAFEKALSTARLVVYEDGGSTMCMIQAGGLQHGHFGLMIADCIRHVARAFDVKEEDVFYWGIIYLTPTGIKGIT